MPISDIITDSTTREELIAHIQDLEEEINKLEEQLKDAEAEVEDLRLAPEQLDRLEEAADLMAGLGHIHPTPHAKQRWIDGK